MESETQDKEQFNAAENENEIIEGSNYSQLNLILDYLISLVPALQI